MQPTAKLRLRSTCRFTSGLRERQQWRTNQNSEMPRIIVAQRIHTAPNQSSSWPLSRTTCRQPVHRINRPKPRLSNAAGLALRTYGGSCTYRLIMYTASAPTGMLM